MDSQDAGTALPPLTMDQCYLAPYGFLGVLSDVLGLYIAVCLAMSRRPLYPMRQIRYRKACHYAGVFVLICYWSLWKENFVQCLRYWQLLLIICSNGIMGVSMLMLSWVMFAASLNQKYTMSDTTEPQAPAESEALLDDAADGTPPAVGTNTAPDTVTSLPMPANGRDIHNSVFDLVSSIWKESRAQDTEEVVPEHENRNSPITSDAEAQRSADSQERLLARLAYLALGIIGCCVICSLVGTVALAVEAIANGSRGSAYFSGFFTLVFLEVVSLVYLTFRPSTPAEYRYPVRAFLLILCGGVAIVYSDLILGCTLGSIAGIPFPDLPAEELSRYWFHIFGLKIHLFAF